MPNARYLELKTATGLKCTACGLLASCVETPSAAACTTTSTIPTIAFTATREAARSALSSMRAGFSAMFAASGACLALYLYERQQLDPVGGGSLLMFVALSALYGTARLPPLRTKGG